MAANSGAADFFNNMKNKRNGEYLDLWCSRACRIDFVRHLA
jgi:hypothetical protein